MIRRPPRSTQSRSSAASDVYKRQDLAVQGGPASPDLLDDVGGGRLPDERLRVVVPVTGPEQDLGRSLERRPEAVRLEGDRRRHHREGPARPGRPEPPDQFNDGPLGDPIHGTYTADEAPHGDWLNIRGLLQETMGEGWRVIDYVVLTDAKDWSVGVEIIGAYT